MDAVIETQPFTVADGEGYRQRALKTGAEFLKAVDAILPVLRAGREQSERDGRVPDASVEAMIDAGCSAASRRCSTAVWNSRRRTSSTA